MSHDDALDRLLALLPLHHLAQEPGPGEGQPGPLTALLTAVARELDVLEDDVRRLRNGWFIETCEEWLVPYLADLVGLAEVPPDLGTAVSRRALVANTVAYRRRKGTLAVLEQVTRDVTGWPTRAVEHHPLLVATAHVNHVRLDRPAAARLRPADHVELASVVSPPSARRALDPLPHTAEVRRTTSLRGRYGTRSVAVYPFSAHVEVVGAPGVAGTGTGGGTGEAPRGPAGGWSRTRLSGGWHVLDPLGRTAPIFAPPRAEAAIEALAGEADLPVPLRPRRLRNLLRAARAGDLDPRDLPIGVRVGAAGTDLAPERVRVCGLEDLAPGADPQVMVDAVAGRLRAYRNGATYTPATVFVRYAYGAAAEVGAGPYNRAERHGDLLASDTWTPPVSTGGTGPRDIQVAVSSGAAPATPGTVTGVAAALDATREAWTDTTKPVVATATISIADSARYTGDLAVTVPTGTRLVLVAARWAGRERPGGVTQEPVAGRYTPDGLRPHVLGTLRITGEAGASVVLDGLLVEGDVTVEPGALGSLTIAHATVTGAVRVLAGAGARNETLHVRLERAVVGSVEAAGTVPLVSVVDSVLDPQARPTGTAALDGAGAHVSLTSTTVRGAVVARSLDSSSCVLEGQVDVAHRQVGCVRFSYVGPGSRTPRRFRCVPADGGDGPPRPVYVSTDPASPAYLVLAASCAPAIRTGGERESEMGVHHHVYRPLRLRAAERQLGPYLPVGSQLGIFGS